MNALRKYDIPDVIIGDNDCQHEWNVITKKASGGINGNVGNNCDTRIHYKAQISSCIHCSAWKGQYGLESTPQMYIEHTLLWAKEAWRVLKNDGIMFLNIGDSYYNPTKWTNKDGAQTIAKGNPRDLLTGRKQDCGLPFKCKLMIPERIAIALVDAGWTLRNTIVWYKPNAMPESVTDRFSKKYEQIFMFTKSNDYYFDLDAVREPHKEVSIERLKRAVGNQNKWVNGTDGQTKHGLSQPRSNYKDRIGSMQNTEYKNGDYLCAKLNPLGKNPGDVWSIPTQPSSEKHYAMWAERLVERMVKCSTKTGDIVLDPFAGSCTTGIVAESLHRKFIGIELGYVDISKRRMSKIQKRLLL